MPKETPADRRRFRSFLVLFVSLLLAGGGSIQTALAAGGGGGDGGGASFTKGRTTRAQQAISEFQSGEKRLGKARDLSVKIAEAREAGDQKKERKLTGKRDGQYKRAERAFRKAIKYDKSLFQAWSQLGYTLRKRGDYEAALAAYDQALDLEPRFAEAVEYRAEAYLHLGRIEDAKASYVRLFKSVRPLSDKLMVKMDEWFAEEFEASNGEPSAEVLAFGEWLVERHDLAGPVPKVSMTDRAVW